MTFVIVKCPQTVYQVFAHPTYVSLTVLPLMSMETTLKAVHALTTTSASLDCAPLPTSHAPLHAHLYREMDLILMDVSVQLMTIV